MRHSPFIEGFKQPTLTKNGFITIADVRGDGQGKLVIWSDQQSQIIVYKGTNRQLEKPSKIKNVSGILSYFDQQRNPKAVLALSAQNGLYIFRSVNQSFRLRIPDIFAKEQQQIIWSQFESDPQKLTAALLKLPKKHLSQTALHLISAITLQRKSELISMVFSSGINQKDSISSMTNLRQTPNSVGNIVLGTELRRIYFLDSYGHSIIQERVVDQAPVILLAHGNYNNAFIVVAIDREGQMAFHMKSNKEQPAEKVKLSSRVISADMNYPDVIVCTEDQVISHFIISNSNTKMHSKKYSFKLPKQPIKVQFFEFKSNKITLIAFQDEIRLYLQKDMIYSFYSQHKLYDVMFGSFAKQQNCMILMYENHGFQVFILHRQFNPKQMYGSNKKGQLASQQIQIPKKTTQFKAYWDQQTDAKQNYKIYQRNIKLLKWMTYRQKFTQKRESHTNLKINSKILGLGPDFIIKLQIQNASDEPIQELKLLPIYNKNNIRLKNMLRQLPMLSPNIQYNLNIKVCSISLKNETFDIQFFYANSSLRTTVHLPNCQEFADL